MAELAATAPPTLNSAAMVPLVGARAVGLSTAEAGAVLASHLNSAARAALAEAEVAAPLISSPALTASPVGRAGKKQRETG